MKKLASLVALMGALVVSATAIAQENPTIEWSVQVGEGTQTRVLREGGDLDIPTKAWECATLPVKTGTVNGKYTESVAVVCGNKSGALSSAILCNDALPSQVLVLTLLTEDKKFLPVYLACTVAKK